MKLFMYNFGENDTAFNAKLTNSLYFINGFHCDIELNLDTLKTLDALTPQFIDLITTTTATICAMGRVGEYAFAIMDDDDNTLFTANEIHCDVGDINWLVCDDIAKINADENANSRKFMQGITAKINFNVIVKPNGDVDTLFAIGFNNEVIQCTCGVGTLSSFDLKNDKGAIEQFEFELKRDDQSEYYIEIYNYITERSSDAFGDDLAVRNENFDFLIECDSITELTHANLITENKFELISKALKGIEHYQGDAYQGPLMNDAPCEGDDIYKQIHSIRSIIGIGHEKYNRDVETARLTVT